MLEAHHLTVSYGAHRALEDVSVHVSMGEICVILGANGAGKSTLLKAISGMVQPMPGAHIAIDGHSINDEKPDRIVEAGLALVPEGRGIFGDLTVAENLELGAYGKRGRGGRAEKLKEVLQLFPKLAERERQIARTMSGGEQQMVAIGRALMSNPKILMLDEPSLGLSPLLSSELFKSLRLVRDNGVGILLVEQNAKQSLAIADRAYLLENGHITGEGRAEMLANDPAVQKAYLGGAADKATHRRLDEGGSRRSTRFAPAEARGGVSASDLAARASRLHSDHIETERHRALAGQPLAKGQVDGHERFHPHNRERIIMSDQASELSQQAADYANRASAILKAHVAAQREAWASDGTQTPEKPKKPNKLKKPKKLKKSKKPEKSKKDKKSKKKTRKSRK
tara:strand:+ start:47443 stop:48633 length:1191 start_codon:yes stop_codon:yes gene_type:complete